MDRGTPVRYNSPIIQRNTPIKRLGLSRKRKSSGSDTSLSKKFHVCCDTFPTSPVCVQNENSNNKNEKEKTESENESIENDENINYKTEIEITQKRLDEKEKKLETLKQKGTKIVHLESLIELWKNGCKNAYLELTQLIKEKELENINCKTVLNNLGVLKTMKEVFENDSDVSLSDLSQ